LYKSINRSKGQLPLLFYSEVFTRLSSFVKKSYIWHIIEVYMSDRHDTD